MDIGQLIILAIIAFATFVAWSFWRGKTRVLRLYVVSVLVLAALVAAAAAQALEVASVIETANVIAIAFSMAGCATSPSLWQEEIRGDLAGLGLYQPVVPRDLLTWRGWLKAVDRLGAGRAALGYLAVFSGALLGATLTLHPPGPSFDRGPYVLALAPTALFALLSTWYLYRGARRLVPGA